MEEHLVFNILQVQILGCVPIGSLILNARLAVLFIWRTEPGNPAWASSLGVGGGQMQLSNMEYGHLDRISHFKGSVAMSNISPLISALYKDTV